MNRIVQVAPDCIKTDCGATIRNARDFLSVANQELFVIPNYSYVCLGTSFFVPIHGSAADFSTVAQTVTRVLLYDPVNDKLISATSDEPEFREHVYNMRSNVLLLRLWLRVKPKSRYFVHQQELENPRSDELLNALQDEKATNVEIRKSRGPATKVQLCKYYHAVTDASSNVMEIPRDSLGRLWDRLEENPVTSFLMHALTRWFA
jgi:hypothetical protein